MKKEYSLQHFKSIRMQQFFCHFQKCMENLKYHLFTQSIHCTIWPLCFTSAYEVNSFFFCPEVDKQCYKLHENQVQTAMKILSQVCAIADQDHRCLDLGRFTQVGLLIIVPPSDVLYQQTLERLYSSGKYTSHCLVD